MAFREIQLARADGEHCYVHRAPSGARLPTFSLKMGRSIAEAYPDDPYRVTFALDPDLTGLKPGALLGNTGRLLLLRRDVANAFTEHLRVGAVEMHPFTLVNEKRRVHSRDYVIFNLLGSVDCLDAEASTIRYRRDGSVARISDMVLDGDRAADLPDIVRVGEKPSLVLFSDDAVAFVESQGYDNFRFGPPLPQTSRTTT